MALIGSPHGCPVLPVSANMALLGRLSAQCAAIRFSYYVHYILCRTHAWNILTDLQGSMQMLLTCLGCIAFKYSCTKLVDYPESSVPLVLCVLKSCLECVSIMPLAQCGSVLPASANMVFRLLSERLLAQCPAIYKFFILCFHDILCKTNAWSTLKHLLGSVQMVMLHSKQRCLNALDALCLPTVAKSSLTFLKIVCALCFAFRNHAQNAFQSCPWHSVHNDSATFCQCLAHPESSVPSVFCIPNLCANCSSVMLLPFATLCTWFPPHCNTLLTIVNVVCPLGFASGAVTFCACVTFTFVRAARQCCGDFW